MRRSSAVSRRRSIRAAGSNSAARSTSLSVSVSAARDRAEQRKGTQARLPQLRLVRAQRRNYLVSRVHDKHCSTRGKGWKSSTNRYVSRCRTARMSFERPRCFWTREPRYGNDSRLIAASGNSQRGLYLWSVRLGLRYRALGSTSLKATRRRLPTIRIPPLNSWATCQSSAPRP